MCGGIITKCNKIGDGKCQNGQCVYTSCKDGYTKRGTECCLNRLHISSSTGSYNNSDATCADYVTMDANIKSIDMPALKSVSQFQTCTKILMDSNLATSDPDNYATFMDIECGNLTSLKLPRLKTAYGLYITGNYDLYLYDLTKLNWLVGSANSLIAPMLKSIDGDIDNQTSCDIDFVVNTLYTPRLESFYLLRSCIYLHAPSYKSMNWTYPDSLSGAVSDSEDCIDIAVIPMPANVCKGFSETCPNGYECD